LDDLQSLHAVLPSVRVAQRGDDRAVRLGDETDGIPTGVVATKQDGERPLRHRSRAALDVVVIRRSLDEDAHFESARRGEANLLYLVTVDDLDGAFHSGHEM
jgi:hypothetical protein